MTAPADRSDAGPGPAAPSPHGETSTGPAPAGLVSPPTPAGKPRTKRRPKDIGTSAETAVVRYLQANGWAGAERRALRGTKDAGDITGTPGVCWEVKGGNAAKTASDGQIDAWLDELAAEKLNAAADVAVLVVQRKGVGPGNAGRWWAIVPAYQLEGLLNGTGRWHIGHRHPIRMTLTGMTAILRTAGYGDPLETS